MVRVMSVDAYVSAADKSWFLFADWQGMTRIVLAGDKVKTNRDLDRPNQQRPLVLRPNGAVWSSYALDIDPIALKKVKATDWIHHSPDPLGGTELIVSHTGDTVTIRGAVHKLVPSGSSLELGGGTREFFDSATYSVFADGSVFVFGELGAQGHASLLLRGPDGSGIVAWSRPLVRVSNGAPSVSRAGGKSYLGDHDGVLNIAYLLVVRDDGVVESTQRVSAIAGPWVLDGKLWWQPDESTVCAGEVLGEATETHILTGREVGIATLLAVEGRKLLLPWHGVSIIDLAHAKGAKRELSRKHKSADEPMYFATAEVIRVVEKAMRPRGVRFVFRGCTRSARNVEPQIWLKGHSDVITYLLAKSLQYGTRTRLKAAGVTALGISGGTAIDDILSPTKPITTEDDLRHLIGTLDSVGVSRAVALPELYSLERWARQRDRELSLTEGAKKYALATVVAGLQGQNKGEPAAVTASVFAKVAPMLRDFDTLAAAGANGTEASLYLALAGHRAFGAEAVQPILDGLTEMSRSAAAEVAQMLAQSPAVP